MLSTNFVLPPTQQHRQMGAQFFPGQKSNRKGCLCMMFNVEPELKSNGIEKHAEVLAGQKNRSMTFASVIHLSEPPEPSPALDSRQFISTPILFSFAAD